VKKLQPERLKDNDGDRCKGLNEGSITSVVTHNSKKGAWEYRINLDHGSIPESLSPDEHKASRINRLHINQEAQMGR
jgi:hypothetical protein